MSSVWFRSVNDAESGENDANLSSQFAASANRRFEFQERRQLFIRTHDLFSIFFSGGCMMMIGCTGVNVGNPIKRRRSRSRFDCFMDSLRFCSLPLCLAVLL